MNGYSKMSMPFSSDPIFAPVINSIAEAVNQIPQTLRQVVVTTVTNDLNDLRDAVGVESPELANTITAKIDGGKLFYSMSGVEAAGLEYGNLEQSPRAFLRKTADKTSRNLEQIISKVTRL